MKYCVFSQRCGCAFAPPQLVLPRRCGRKGVQKFCGVITPQMPLEQFPFCFSIAEINFMCTKWALKRTNFESHRTAVNSEKLRGSSGGHSRRYKPLVPSVYRVLQNTVHPSGACCQKSTKFACPNLFQMSNNHCSHLTIFHLRQCRETPWFQPPPIYIYKQRQ